MRPAAVCCCHEGRQHSLQQRLELPAGAAHCCCCLLLLLLLLWLLLLQEQVNESTSSSCSRGQGLTTRPGGQLLLLSGLA
jgi:hypothetical protein